MSKYNVYISYSESDAELALSYSQQLSDVDLTHFIDNNHGSTTQSHANSVQSAILDSDAILFIYGKDSEESIEQRQELDFALENNKRVFYVLKRSLGHGIIHTKLKKKCFEGSIENIVHYIFPNRFPSRYGVHYCPDIKAHDVLPIEAPKYKVHEPIPNPTVKSNFRRRMWVATIVIGVLFIFGATILFFRYDSHNDEVSCFESRCFNDTLLEGDGLFHDDIVEPTWDAMTEEGSEYEPMPAMPESSPDLIVDETIYDEDIYEDDSSYPDDISGRVPIEDEMIIDDDIYKTDEKTSNRWIDNKTQWVVGIISGVVGFIIGIVLMIALRRHKKSNNVKLSSDVDVSITVDNTPLVSIGAREVYSTHLNKGEYIIDFTTNEKQKRHNRVIQNIEGKGPYVIFSKFGAIEVERKFKCFIAGSIALTPERDALRAVIAELHNQWEAEKFQINSYTFEDFSRDVVIGGQQKLYDTFIAEDADWVVFIIADGIGDKTLNEYRVAMDSYIQYGHPKILFLAHSDSTNDPVVKNIKREIIQSEQYWNSCNNVEQMKALFYKCLNWDITLLSKRATRS